jgi:hypothetical protein
MAGKARPVFDRGRRHPNAIRETRHDMGDLPMRRTLPAVLTAVALSALAGCVQFSSDVNIDAKGGGTATVSMSVASDVLAARTELDRIGGDAMGMALPVYADITRPYLEKRGAGHGVTVTSFAKSTAAGRETFKCSLAFGDLKGMSWVLNDISGALGGAGLGIARGEGGNLVLRSRQYNFPSAAKKATPTPTAEQSQRQAELATTLIGAIGELDIKLNVTVPGNVVRSNAPLVAGRTSTWAINAGNMMNQQDVSPEIVFSGQGLAIKVTE